MTGCGGDEPPPYASTGSPPNGGGGGRAGRGQGGEDAGPGSDGGEAGRAGSRAGSGGRGGSSGASAGSGGSNAMDSGMANAGAPAIEVPDSPANPWIAFVTLDSSNFGQLFFVKADGTGSAEYNGDTFLEEDPSWSPDGTKLAFTGLNATNGNKELHVLDLTAGTDDVLDTGLAAQTRPRWSADGSELVVAGGEQANDKSALFRIDAATGDSTPLTAPIMGDAGHDVAADGMVYFVRKSGTAAFDIFSVSITDDPSTDPTRITTGSNVLGGVAVHPDATRLLFSRANAMSTDLVEYTIASGDERVIGSPGDEQADYTAGGDGLVVSRDSFDADSEIAVADADGMLVMRCTDDPVINQSPTISAAESGDVDISPFVP